MNENTEKEFRIVLEYIKDLSIETPSANTLLMVREKISNYAMDIDISSLILKNKSLEITTRLTLQDKGDSEDKAFFEIKYASIIYINSDIKEKEKISKIVLCDLQKLVYPKIEKIFLDLIKNAGYPEIKFDRKVDFEKLYNDRFN